MAVDKSLCPECGGKMVAGFVPEYTQYRVMRSLWIEGNLERSFWTGSQVREKDVRAVVSWRCTRCGLLRSYAAGKVPRPSHWG